MVPPPVVQVQATTKNIKYVIGNPSQKRIQVAFGVFHEIELLLAQLNGVAGRGVPVANRYFLLVAAKLRGFLVSGVK